MRFLQGEGAEGKKTEGVPPATLHLPLEGIFTSGFKCLRLVDRGGRTPFALLGCIIPVRSHPRVYLQ